MLRCDSRRCEQNKKKCDARGSRLQGRTFTTTRLDDEDVLSSHALLDLDPRLAALELVQQHLGLGYAEVVADGPVGQSARRPAVRRGYVLCQLRMRSSAKHHNVPHLGGRAAAGEAGEAVVVRLAAGARRAVSDQRETWTGETGLGARVENALIDKGKRFGLGSRAKGKGIRPG